MLHYARKLTSSFKNARYLTNFYPKPSLKKPNCRQWQAARIILSMKSIRNSFRFYFILILHYPGIVVSPNSLTLKKIARGNYESDVNIYFLAIFPSIAECFDLL